MNRRKFLSNSLKMGMAPIAISGLSLKGISASMIPANTCDINDRSVVIVYLNGGNDIFNTMVPLNHYDTYVNRRPSVHLNQNQLLTLDNTLGDSQQLGLHPNMTAFKNLYESGKMSIIQGVSYPVPNRSHFASLDIMLRGGTGTSIDAEGWIARYFKDRFPNYSGAPSSNDPDPLGLIFGNINGTGFHTEQEHAWEINLSEVDPGGFFALISSLSGQPIFNFPNSEYGNMLRYLTGVEYGSNFYSGRISSVSQNGSNTTSYPSNPLSTQLQSVAKLLSGGSRTKVFMVQQGGYDTHGFQLGTHANLLSDLSGSLSAFQTDLDNQGIGNNVLTVVFSEFGRKIIENGSFGTDHGTLSSMFVVGNNVNPGVIGNNIDLTQEDDQGAPKPEGIAFDYRKVLSTVLQDWLGASDSSVANTFLSNSFVIDKPPIIMPSAVADPSCYLQPSPPSLEPCGGEGQNYSYIDENGNCVEVDCLDGVPNAQQSLVLDENAYMTPIDVPKVYAQDSIQANGELQNIITSELELKAGKQIRLSNNFHTKGRAFNLRIKGCE